MKSHAVKVTSDGLRASIVVDGHDITDAVRRGSPVLRIGVPEELPVLSLDLVVWNLETETGDTVVQIPPATRDALYALGWTPPGGESG